MTLDNSALLLAAVGAYLVGGVFFAFSSFVMAALADLPRPQGMSAMQAINRRAPTPWFMSAFFGTLLLVVAVSVLAIASAGEEWTGWAYTGTGLYLATFLMTVAYHVPRNNELDRVDPEAPGATEPWLTYMRSWTLWNHVRTLTACLAGVALTVAFGMA